MDAKQARDAARQALVGMRAGRNPNEERRKARARGITLRGALDLHLAAKPLSTRTKDDYRYNCEQYLAEWMDKPLAELGADRAGVRERHRRIVDQIGHREPATPPALCPFGGVGRGTVALDHRADRDAEQVPTAGRVLHPYSAGSNLAHPGSDTMRACRT
jgi:hypothetical protein